jgi:hypothetical protein
VLVLLTGPRGSALARKLGVVDDLGKNDDSEAWFSLITNLPASGGMRGLGSAEERKKEGRLSMIAGALVSSTSGELRGVPGFSERRKDCSEVPSCIF